jgi:hypothetical protein
MDGCRSSVAPWSRARATRQVSARVVAWRSPGHTRLGHGPPALPKEQREQALCQTPVWGLKEILPGGPGRASPASKGIMDTRAGVTRYRMGDTISRGMTPGQRRPCLSLGCLHHPQDKASSERGPRLDMLTDCPGQFVHPTDNTSAEGSPSGSSTHADAYTRCGMWIALLSRRSN